MHLAQWRLDGLLQDRIKGRNSCRYLVLTLRNEGPRVLLSVQLPSQNGMVSDNAGYRAFGAVSESGDPRNTASCHFTCSAEVAAKVGDFRLTRPSFPYREKSLQQTGPLSITWTAFRASRNVHCAAVGHTRLKVSRMRSNYLALLAFVLRVSVFPSFGGGHCCR